MRTTRSGLLLLSVTTLLVLGACNANKQGKAASASASASPIEAKVNGAAIRQASVDLMLRQSGGGQPMPPEARQSALDNLVLQTVVAQEAVKMGLDKSPEFVAQMDVVRSSALANAYVQDYIKKHPVTDEMMKAEYERIKASTGGTQFKARHILVETEDEAKSIIATLKKTPGAFQKLASEKTKDPGSKGSGGDLGWFDPQQMVPEFSAALAKLEKGKFTEEPVKSQFGYHVILLEDTRPIEPMPLEAVQGQLSQQIMQQNIRKQVDALKAAAKVEMVAAAASAPATAPAASGASATK